MNPYQKAADALKVAVKTALDDNVDANLQSEIWRHFQGMQNIADQLKDKTTDYNFSLSTSAFDPDYNITFPTGVVAADTINLDSIGNDVITFS